MKHRTGDLIMSKHKIRKEDFDEFANCRIIKDNTETKLIYLGKGRMRSG